MSQHSADLPDAVVDYLRSKAREGFYGRVTISFQAGRAGEIRTEEVRKVSELDDKKGGS